MTFPDDADKVLNAVRLGWSIAEVRGRNRPDAPPGSNARLPGPPSHALPLHIEQTPTEQRIEAQAVLTAMAEDLGVDLDAGNHSYSKAIDSQAERLYYARAGAAVPAGAAALAGAAAPGGAAPGETAAAAAPVAPVGTAAAGAAAAPAAGADDPATLWDALQELIFKFDEHIQDTLASGADTIASGYQFGRALAEPYWALDPTLGESVQSPAAWSFLLGSDRCDEMSRLAGRLTAYFPPYTPAAIAGSVQMWESVARTPNWRQDADAYPRLYQQVRRWYGLILLKQDPTTLITPYQLLSDFRLVWRVARMFWVQIMLAALAAAALFGFAYLLSLRSVNSVLTTVLAGVGVTGFSVAGLAAKVKNDAQAMFARIKEDAYTDLIAAAITTAPAPPKSGPLASSRQKAAMAEIIRARRLTPQTPD